MNRDGVDFASDCHRRCSSIASFTLNPTTKSSKWSAKGSWSERLTAGGQHLAIETSTSTTIPTMGEGIWRVVPGTNGLGKLGLPQ